MNKYKVIFIDWNGTLSISKFWGHLSNSTRENKVFFNKIENTLFCDLKHLLNPWMKGELNSENVIAEIAKHTNISYEFLLNEFIKSCEEMKYISLDICKLIKKLKKKGYMVVIATDNMDSFNRWTVPSLKVYELFDYILNSYDLKVMKNDFDKLGNILFFKNFVDKHKIGPGESILIDDSEDIDNRINKYGIDYFKITSSMGLKSVLKKLL